MERLAGVRERLDGPLDREILTGNLRDLVRINRWLGGAALSRRAVREAMSPRGRVTTVLDVGTGAADIPVDLLRAVESDAQRLSIDATDIRPEVIEIARRSAAGRGVNVRLARLEDEGDRSYSVVHASLVLHHLDAPDAATFLREMARVARDAVVINDLDRAHRWLFGASILARLLTRNAYTRDDAPLSIRRAYRPDEIVALARRAGLEEVARFWTRPRYRYAIVFRHAERGAGAAVRAGDD